MSGWYYLGPSYNLFDELDDIVDDLIATDPPPEEPKNDRDEPESDPKPSETS